MFSGHALMTPLVMRYLSETLNTDMQVWLTDQIVRQPYGFTTFILSTDGQECIRYLFESYRDKMDKPPKVD